MHDCLTFCSVGVDSYKESTKRMYSVDSKDFVVEITDIPQSSIGAPCPMILAREHSLHLAYYLEDPAPDWDGTTIRVVDPATSNEPVALVEFVYVYAHMFGPPNDEAFNGHPLESRGLRPYSVYEIRHSSWIRCLERMNSVHPHHESKVFDVYKHFIFAFHDTTFECVARSYIVTLHKGSVMDIIKQTSWC
jgi:hypothetical protein